ncbi:hypothetical protein [Streptomyces sp. BA2]|uniref:hypothetical protein n=1 Tax=Streptomyces sp. BA2 TaxID=436595 RepID=UPI001327A823|nr:hypothetical protein [Streptomyces sp. BA2]MWA08106.1 hypothetical protein [Streptomyces sp. BA2]
MGRGSMVTSWPRISVKDGVCLAWAPRVELIEDLMMLKTTRQRHRLLIDRRSDVVDDVEESLTHVDHPALSDDVHFSLEAATCVRAGHDTAAQALPGNLLDTLMRRHGHAWLQGPFPQTQFTGTGSHKMVAGALGTRSGAGGFKVLMIAPYLVVSARSPGPWPKCERGVIEVDVPAAGHSRCLGCGDTGLRVSKRGHDIIPGGEVTCPFELPPWPIAPQAPITRGALWHGAIQGVCVPGVQRPCALGVTQVEPHQQSCQQDLGCLGQGRNLGESLLLALAHRHLGALQVAGAGCGFAGKELGCRFLGDRHLCAGGKVAQQEGIPDLSFKAQPRKPTHRAPALADARNEVADGVESRVHHDGEVSRPWGGYGVVTG